MLTDRLHSGIGQTGNFQGQDRVHPVEAEPRWPDTPQVHRTALRDTRRGRDRSHFKMYIYSHICVFILIRLMFQHFFGGSGYFTTSVHTPLLTGL